MLNIHRSEAKTGGENQMLSSESKTHAKYENLVLLIKYGLAVPV